MNRLKKIFLKTFPSKLADDLYHYKNLYYANISFSQEGEDLVLDRFFEQKKVGFYVDIGAHHPLRFSNTHKFYKRGWRGINVDAMPGSMTVFNAVRSRDVNLEMAISDKHGNLTYYMFNEPALNTFSNEMASFHSKPPYRVVDKKEIRTITLKTLLDDHLPENTPVDFLTIDVEGLDLNVLMSNDWEKYRPTYILIESLKTDLDDIRNNETYIYLREKGYNCVAKTCNTLFFRANT